MIVTSLLRSQRGATAVLVVLWLPVLIAGVGMALDSMGLFSARGHLQSAADSAALAGVQEVDTAALIRGQLLLQANQARQKASAYVTTNAASWTRFGLAVTDWQVDVHSPRVKVRIEARYRLPLPLAGYHTVPLSAQATAAVKERPPGD